MQKTLEERVKILEENLYKCLKINQVLLARVETLEKNLEQLERERNDEIIERKMEKELTHTKFKNFSVTTENDYGGNSPAPPKIQHLATNTVNVEYFGEDFLKDYNVVLSKTDGYEKQSARKNFIAKYNVRFFNCVNFNERMNNPNVEPVFEENSAAQRGDYWAIPISGNTFKVVPNVNSYTENYHVARAMGAVFDSNYINGSYSNIQLERAAEFTNSGQNWILTKKGKLILR